MFNQLENKLDNLGHKKGILIAFLLGFVVRSIPEIISAPYPIGWDTVYYASRISAGTVFTVGSDLVNSWFIYGLLVAIGNLTHLDPILILKIFAPILYAGTCAGIYVVAWKRFNWSVTKSFLTAMIFSFQLAALAISWQFYRNIFGIMVLLFAIPLIRKETTWKGLIALSLLALFTVWGHELAMASLFFIIFGMLLQSVIKKEKIPYRLFLAILPAVVLFMGNLFWISPFAAPINTNLIRIDDSVWAHPGGLFFLTDYLTVKTPIESYSTYFSLISNVGSLFIILYVLTLPLVIIGFFKDRILNLWTILLLVGAFGCLAVPFSALFLWARWMLLLIYPIAFFASNGLWKVSKKLKGIKFSRFIGNFKITRKIAASLIVVIMIIGSLFMVWPLMDGRYGLINWSGSFKYFPSTMQSNSIPLQDIDGTIKAYEWLNNNMDSYSSLLVSDPFDTWTMLYLNETHRGYLFDFDLELALNHAIAEGYESAYFIWWNQDIGWYDIKISENWVPIQEYERITIYKIL